MKSLKSKPNDKKDQCLLLVSIFNCNPTATKATGVTVFPILKKVFCNASCDSIEYWILVVGIICIVIFIFGIYNLLNVLKARIKPIGYPLSNVFFGDIAKSKTYNDYERLLNEATSENYRRDLITQIFINSRVCRKKHLLFNEGLKFVSYPLPLIFCCWGYLF